MVATIPMRERTTPIMVSVANGTGDGIQSSNLEQISWITYESQIYSLIIAYYYMQHILTLTTRIAKLVRWLQLQVTTSPFTSAISQPSVVHSG